MSEPFFERCYEVVKQIPEGRVATYGQIARMLGEPRRARYVGYAMHSRPASRSAARGRSAPCSRRRAWAFCRTAG